MEAVMDLGFPAIAIAVIIVVIYLLSSIKILAEYERGVIFRLGRLLGTAKGPGVILVFTPIDRMVRISLRQEALEVPPQDIITRDNVTLKVNAVIFLRVIDPNKAVVEVSNYAYQTSQFAQTTLRSVLGEQELDELLAHRALGREGCERGSEAGRYAGVDAARDGEAGGGGAGKEVEDHPRGGRIFGGAAAGGCGALAVVGAGQHSAAVLANTDGNWRGEEYDGGVSGADRFLLGHAKLAGGRKSGGHAGENLEVKVNFHGNGSARHGDHAWHGSHAGDFFCVCADLRFFLCDRIFAGQKNCAGWNGQPAERGRRGSGNNCAAVGGKERRGPGSGPVVIAPDKRL
jgi:hypothetical protein